MRSTVPTPEEEAAAVAFRRQTLLPLDDCLYALQPAVPHLTRSSLHRLLVRHGISRLPEVGGDKPGKQAFDQTCRAHGIGHRLTKPSHPWTNGQVERMNRTLKDATVKRRHYGSHDQLKAHLAAFLDAYNVAKRLKTLPSLTPYEAIRRAWSDDPDCSTLNPAHLTRTLAPSPSPSLHHNGSLFGGDGNPSS